VSDFPEITTEQIVARLRMIVAEPDSLCKTDFHYIEDAADEIELLRSTVTDYRIEIERLTAERDEMQGELRKAETESSMLRVECGVIAAERDEARREVLLWVKERCSWVELTEEIKQRGWEYLKETYK